MSGMYVKTMMSVITFDITKFGGQMKENKNPSSSFLVSSLLIFVNNNNQATII